MKNRRAQSVIEYFIMMSLVVGVLLGTDLLGRVRVACEMYFNQAIGPMLH